MGGTVQFENIDPRDLKVNPFSRIGDDWMLVTVQDGERANPMTASWGGLGILWGEPVATCYIRPQRYTRELMDSSEYFALCFFEPGQQREALALCGSRSGRDTDKVKETGLTVCRDKAAPYFAEASLVYICRKLYRQEMSADCFIDGDIAKHYPDNDYHIMYIGKIEECLVREPEN